MFYFIVFSAFSWLKYGTLNTVLVWGGGSKFC